MAKIDCLHDRVLLKEKHWGRFISYVYHQDEEVFKRDAYVNLYSCEDCGKDLYCNWGNPIRIEGAPPLTEELDGY